MTTPTQAQIEAAAKALYGDHGVPPSDKAMGMARAALTAAQVGEPSDHVYMRGFVDGGKETKAATIERCAQVVREILKHRVIHVDVIDEIDSAIRKLKDEP